MADHRNLIKKSLLLRPYDLKDASMVAEFTLNDAKQWIGTHREKCEIKSGIRKRDAKGWHAT